MNRFFRSGLLPLILIVLVVYLASTQLMHGNKNTKSYTYSDFITQVKNDNVDNAVFNPNKQSISFTLKNNEGKGSVHYPSTQSTVQLTTLMEAHGVTSFDSKGIGGSAWWSILTGLLPFVLLFGFWIFLMNQVQGGGSKVMSFGKSRAKRMTPDSPKIGFKDVAGVDEAVEELQEIKEFLENPKKFQALGARIPKGVLLYGPPGTGKTLLARAVAGEAGVPFFSISGSDFVEMFVGVGASRVRDLFEQAKQASPCIVFMHEIDAVGRHRGAGLGGGHEPARHPRPGPPPPGPLRPADRRRPARPQRPPEDPRGALQGQAARVRDRPRHARGRHSGLHRRRPREPRQRG